jgi:carbon-monoxide dehydrogenase medium subunit
MSARPNRACPHKPEHQAKEATIYPARFRYEAPRSIEEAISLLQDGGGDAKVLAGGQSLIPMMKLRFASPEMLVDINEIPDLGYHRIEDDGTMHVGALCRHGDLERSTVLPGRQPTMASAAPLVADPIVRSRGTLVGSVCHADPQGDWASVMTALDAQIVAQGPSGRRFIAVRDFVRGPFQNALAFDEIAVEAVVPAPANQQAGGYLKLERRVGDYATVGVAVAIERSGTRVTRAGIALTAVGPATIAADGAGEALVGRPLSMDTIGEAAEQAAQAAQPKSDHRGTADFKRQIVRVFTSRILSGLLQTEEEAA